MQENKITNTDDQGAGMSSGRAGSWLTALSFLCLAGQTVHLVFNCENNMAGSLGLQPLLFRIPGSFPPGPPTLGLDGTMSCNLISSSETKDPFSIPSSKEALHAASGSLSPPVSLPCKTLTPENDALAEFSCALALQTGT